MLLLRSDLPDAKSRALDNIGRVFARVGKFQQAIDTWEEKIPLAKTTLEKTWLFHEIGRCYLELDQAWQAQSYGEKSQQYAEEEGDLEWQLNASVLVAQAQVKLRDFESAVNNFEKALERAKLVHNNEAQQAIISALDDANKGIIEELKKTNYREILREKAERQDISSQMEFSGASEKETRRGREEQERVVKQWERELESEREATEDEEGSKQRLLRVEEQDGSSSGLTSSKMMLGDTPSTSQMMRRESREIYRRISEDSTQPTLDDISQNQEKPSETAMEERLEKTEEDESKSETI